MNITFAKPSRPDSGTLVVGVGEGGALSPAAVSLDRAVKGAVKRAIAADSFEGKARQFLSIVAPAGIKAGRIVLAGLGKGKDFDASAAEKLGGALTAYREGVEAGTFPTADESFYMDERALKLIERMTPSPADDMSEAERVLTELHDGAATPVGEHHN